MQYTFTTSGTTGESKTFVMLEDLVQSRIDAKVKGEAFEGIASLFCDMNVNSWSGFRAKRWAEQRNIRFFNFSGSTKAATDLFDREAVEGIIGYPNALLAYAEANIDRPYRFKAVLSTGASLSHLLSRTIRKGLGDNLFTSYGTSEVGSIALGTAEQVESCPGPGCVGSLCEGVEVKFIDDTIYVRTQTMIDGYIDPILTDKYFKDGWFIPGDKGHMTSNNLLVVYRRVR